jgi:hypothetical protein
MAWKLKIFCFSLKEAANTLNPGEKKSKVDKICMLLFMMLLIFFIIYDIFLLN